MTTDHALEALRAHRNTLPFGEVRSAFNAAIDRLDVAISKETSTYTLENGSLAAVVAFLTGEAPLDGLWFGEMPTDGRGMYWWRSHLRAAIQAPAEGDATQQPSVILDGETPFAFVAGELYEFQQATSCDTADDYRKMLADKPKDQTEWDRVYSLIRHWSQRAQEAEAKLAAEPNVQPKGLAAAAQELSEFFWAKNLGHVPAHLVANLRDALRGASSPAPAPEPVAWRYQDARGNFRYRGYRPGFDVSHAILKPVALYAAPAPCAAVGAEVTEELESLRAQVALGKTTITRRGQALADIRNVLMTAGHRHDGPVTELHERVRAAISHVPVQEMSEQARKAEALDWFMAHPYTWKPGRSGWDGAGGFTWYVYGEKGEYLMRGTWVPGIIKELIKRGHK